MAGGQLRAGNRRFPFHLPHIFLFSRISFCMMNVLFGLMLLAGLLCSMLGGDANSALDAMLAGCGEAITLSLSMAGGYMLWMGLMNVAKQAGLIESLSKLVKRPLSRLFPGSEEAVAPITLNLAANFFGMGSAATPFGLAAMKALDAAARRQGIPPGTASDAMCMFLALNASAIELLPTGVLALRAAAGSQDVYCVVAPTFIASILSFVAAVILAKLLCRAFPAEGRQKRQRRHRARAGGSA
ncbi:MAG: hypothetical protein E7330_05010 [Clostridiales bacterium]|nr:hypothetical protein [Clostridiales bacterium]